MGKTASGVVRGWYRQSSYKTLISYGFPDYVAKYLLGAIGGDRTAAVRWLQSSNNKIIANLKEGEYRQTDLDSKGQDKRLAALDFGKGAGKGIDLSTGAASPQNVEQTNTQAAALGLEGSDPTTPNAGTLAPSYQYYDPKTGQPTDLAQQSLDLIRRQGVDAQRQVQGNLSARGVGVSGAALRGAQQTAQQTADQQFAASKGMKDLDKADYQRWQSLVAGHLGMTSSEYQPPEKD